MRSTSIVRTFSAPLPGFKRASSYNASGVSHLFFISVTADEEEKDRETRLLLSKAEDAEDEAIARESEEEKKRVLVRFK